MSKIPTDDLLQISIHALREEGDAFLLHRYKHSLGISIHALREEGDQGRLGR